MEDILNFKKIDISKSWIWIFAVIVSIILNTSIFGFMPSLIHSISEKDNAIHNLKPVNLVNYKREKILPENKKTSKKELKPELKIFKSKTCESESFKNRVIPDLNFKDNFKPEIPKINTHINPGLIAGLNSSDMILPEFYEIGDLDMEPVPIVRINPVYPESAMRLGIEGKVKIRFMVNEKGMVENKNIIEAKPTGIFEKSVLTSLSRWKFRPGMVEGKPVKTLMETVIRFRQEEG